ncbi:Uncharacterised protein [Vibrio cholerae]|nr:Uncharacterised protein [Vibrio cholerae]CSC04507.1 Uncharacterised protein [Vibrio cholerae]
MVGFTTATAKMHHHREPALPRKGVHQAVRVRAFEAAF